jgi:hypothetical protein
LQTRRKLRSRPTPIFEWIFIFALVSFCVGLTFLQYKWTGQISQSEAVQLKARLNDDLQSLCSFFDSTISQAYYDLTPEPDELDQGDFETIHAALIKNWKSTKPPAFLKRIGYAIPDGKQLALYLVNLKEQNLSRAPWPDRWKDLQSNLSEKLSGPGGVGPYSDPMGTLIEFPVFAKRGRRGARGNDQFERQPQSQRFSPGADNPPGEKEWAIFELDLDYIKNAWMPALLNKYLGPNRNPLLSYVQV